MTVVVCRIQYQCRSAGYAGTDGARRPASGRAFSLPGIRDLFGALTALRSRFPARVHDANQPLRGLFDRFQFSPFARGFHEGNSSDGVSQGVVRE